jgi:hypothetical protein
VFDRVKTGAFGEHPSREDAFGRAVEKGFIDFDEGAAQRDLGRGARVAGARGHSQSAEGDGLPDLYLKRRDAPSHLIEGREHGHAVCDLIRSGRRRDESEDRKSGSDRRTKRDAANHSFIRLSEGLTSKARPAKWSER